MSLEISPMMRSLHLPFHRLDLSCNSALLSDISADARDDGECNAVRECISSYLQLVKQSTRAFIGTLRKRFLIRDLAAQHIENRIPHDVVSLLGMYVWSTRCDPQWIKGQELEHRFVGFPSHRFVGYPSQYGCK